MKGSLYTVFFAAVLGILCASMLTGVGSLTKPYRLANRDADEKRHILTVLEVPFGTDDSSTRLLKIYEENVRQESRGDLTVYSYVTAEGGLQASAVHFEGSGLWGPIKGYLALEPGLRIIRGLTFYEQVETPGLGGRISEAQWLGSFKGRSVVSKDGVPGIRITRNPSAANEVDAISGATMTCDKVQAMLNATIERIVGKDGGGE